MNNHEPGPNEDIGYAFAQILKESRNLITSTSPAPLFDSAACRKLDSDLARKISRIETVAWELEQELRFRRILLRALRRGSSKLEHEVMHELAEAGDELVELY